MKIMKNLFFSIFLVLMMLTSSVFITNVSGEGTRERKIELEAEPYVLNITNLSLRNSPNIVVHIRPTEIPYVSVTTDANVIDNIIIDINNRSHIIDISSACQYQVAQFIVEVSVPISTFNYRGAFDLDANIEAVPSFALNGGGRIDGTLQINEIPDVNINQAGAINMILKGSVGNFICECNGGGNITAHELQTHNSKFELSGGGTVSIYADTSLKINARGQWNCNYSGTPSIDFHPAGNCKLNRI